MIFILQMNLDAFPLNVISWQTLQFPYRMYSHCRFV
jgi:hypothetical protein